MEYKLLTSSGEVEALEIINAEILKAGFEENIEEDEYGNFFLHYIVKGEKKINYIRVDNFKQLLQWVSTNYKI